MVPDSREWIRHQESKGGDQNKDQSEQRNIEQCGVRFPGAVVIEVDGKEKKEEVTVTQSHAFRVDLESAFRPDLTDAVSITVQMEESAPPFQAVKTVIRGNERESGSGCTNQLEERPHL